MAATEGVMYWSLLGEQQHHPKCMAMKLSPSFSSCSDSEAIGALNRYLPSNNEEFYDSSSSSSVLYSSDEFRMYEFKVRRCMRSRSHDWTECPFMHPGEKARRRDPRRFNYSGTPCPEFRKGSCRRGDSCELAHGVFECWLHPDRYRTQPCKDGRNCTRRICFFAHTTEQLRNVEGSPSSPSARTIHRISESKTITNLAKSSVMSSPTSTLIGLASPPPSLSPPSSPESSSFVQNSDSFFSQSDSPCYSRHQLRQNLSFRCSSTPPRQTATAVSKPGLTHSYSMPTSAMRSNNSNNNLDSSLRPAMSDLLLAMRALEIENNNAALDSHNNNNHRGVSKFHNGFEDLYGVDEEPVQRVESGRDLRAKIYARLAAQNNPDLDFTPDLAWKHHGSVVGVSRVTSHHAV